MLADAVLLEWEGVLVDTVDARHDALVAALAAAHLSRVVELDDDALRGLAPSEAASAALTQAGIDDPTLAELVALRAGRAFVDRLGGGFVLQPGVGEFLAHAQHQSKLAIVTRATRAETDFVLRLSGLDLAMTSVVTHDEARGANPWSLALDQLARRRGVRAERALALCAALPEIRAARDAGLRVVAVGVPAHVALEADASIGGLSQTSLEALAGLAGVAAAERRA
jgi:beta-phosphoglucomutase-like phosphatase (HAD superfamily)